MLVDDLYPLVLVLLVLLFQFVFALHFLFPGDLLEGFVFVVLHWGVFVFVISSSGVIV